MNPLPEVRLFLGIPVCLQLNLLCYWKRYRFHPWWQFLLVFTSAFSSKVLAFLSAIAKIRTPVVVCADKSSAVRCFVLYSNCSPIFRIYSWSIMRSKSRRQGKQLSAVVKNSWVNSPDFGFIWILMSTLPSIFNPEFLSANTFFKSLYASRLSKPFKRVENFERNATPTVYQSCYQFFVQKQLHIETFCFVSGAHPDYIGLFLPFVPRAISFNVR